jgi:hypothetical protein
MAGTLALQSGDLRILAGQQGQQQGQSVRLEILPQELALFAERFPVSAEKNIDSARARMSVMV